MVDGYVGCVGNCCCWEKICWKHGKVGGGVGGGLKAEKVDGGKNDCWWCIVAGGGYGGGCCKKNDGREGGDGCGKRLSIYCYFHY